MNEARKELRAIFLNGSNVNGSVSGSS